MDLLTLCIPKHSSINHPSLHFRCLASHHSDYNLTGATMQFTVQLLLFLWLYLLVLGDAH